MTKRIQCVNLHNGQYVMVPNHILSNYSSVKVSVQNKEMGLLLCGNGSDPDFNLYIHNDQSKHVFLPDWKNNLPKFQLEFVLQMPVVNWSLSEQQLYLLCGSLIMNDASSEKDACDSASSSNTFYRDPTMSLVVNVICP